MNPLDIPGTVFSLEARNWAWRAASSKDGPKYKITFECDYEAFQTFSQANLDSAAFAIAMNRIDYDDNCGPVDLSKTSLPTPDLPTTGSPKQNRRYSETEVKAIMLCKDKEFQLWANSGLAIFSEQYPDGWCYGCNEIGARGLILDKCKVGHRRDIDKSPESAKAFAAIVSEFEKWKKENKDG